MKLLIALLVLLAGASPQIQIRSDQVVEQAAACLGPLPVGWRLEPARPPAGAALTDGQLTWRSVPLSGLNDPVPRVRVEALVDGTPRRTWLVAFRKLQVRNVLVVARPILRGSRPEPEDVRVESRAVDPTLALLESLEQLEGYELRRNVAPGELLRTRDLSPRCLVPAGQTVTLKRSVDGLTIQIQVRTLEPGYAGRSFRVRTPSGAVLNARVAPEGEVIPAGP
ncbi:MAG: flagellar basal body P-ring formation chaperone FlgA [Candidatus Eremiobacterota bacterium]